MIIYVVDRANGRMDRCSIKMDNRRSISMADQISFRSCLSALPRWKLCQICGEGNRRWFRSSTAVPSASIIFQLTGQTNEKLSSIKHKASRLKGISTIVGAYGHGNIPFRFDETNNLILTALDLIWVIHAFLPSRCPRCLQEKSEIDEIEVISGLPPIRITLAPLSL